MRQWMLVVVALLLAAGVSSAAAARPPRAKARERAERDRIKDGVKDGSLTPSEAKRLAEEQRRIQERAKDAASDGVVTPAEKAGLERAQDRASDSIAKERHDLQGEMGPKPNWKVWDPGVNQRQFNQRLRIAQGIRSGSLTADEAKGLVAMEKDIAQMEREMKSDGVLSKEERQQLHSALNETSQAIYDEKHDGDTRPPLRATLKAKIENGRLTEAEAKELFAQARRLVELRRLLGGEPLPPERRKVLEQEYAQLASQLFE